MPYRCVGILCLLSILALPSMAQDRETGQDTQGTPNAQAAQNSAEPQGITKTQKKKTENTAEPEAHGTRLQWKDLPKNIWNQLKYLISRPLLIIIHID